MVDRGRRLCDKALDWIALCNKPFTAEGPRKRSRKLCVPILRKAKRAPVDPRRYQREGGFLLLAVLLLMAFMIIAASIEIPEMVQQLKRDREEEMIHRGTEYARAVKKYYKKFGRYPANLEQLDNTNQIRFLRKRYKDPLTKDGKWKTLTYGDILSLLNPNAPGTPAAALGAQGQSAFGQPSAVTSLGTTGSPSSQSPTPSPGNIVYTSSTGFDTNGPFAPRNRRALPATRREVSPETRRKATLSRATVLSTIPSAWERVAARTPTNREARALERIPQVAIRHLVAEPSSASPA